MIIATIASNNQNVSFEAMKSWLKLPAYSKLWAEGPYIDFNRNEIWRRMKEIPMPDHLLMIDIDIVFTPEDVAKIEMHLNNGLDVVGGVYLIGKPPKDPCIFERLEGDYKLTALKEGLNEVDAIGTGFLGVNANVIENMPDNPFSYLKEGEIIHGEDISFCHRVREKGYKIWCDSEIKVGHIRPQVIYP
jgi:hypothetical protein